MTRIIFSAVIFIDGYNRGQGICGFIQYSSIDMKTEEIESIVFNF